MDLTDLFIIGEIVVVGISFPFFARSIPSFKEMLSSRTNKEKRIEMAKIVLPMLIPVLTVEIILDLLSFPYAFVFSSAMFILWISLLIPLYLSVFQKERCGFLKVLAIGMAWAIFFICMAFSTGSAL